MRALRRQIEFEELDGDETLAGRIVCTKYRSQRSRTDLMKDPKTSERVRRRIASRVSVQ
jgi:hypothetical protein